MFGKKIEFEFPPIDPSLVETIRLAMSDAESALPGGNGAAKKAWVKAKVKDAAKHLDLKKVPGFLEDPIREAVISVIVDVVWATVFRKKNG